jgi:hypothetical protein
MDADLNDLRGVERFLAARQLKGTFGPSPVQVIDVSEVGAQIAHLSHFRLGMKALFRLHHERVESAVRAVVVWSRYGASNETGTRLYRSGLHLETTGDEFIGAVGRLLHEGALKRDAESLQRKSERRALQKEKAPAPRVEPSATITPEVSNLVRYARKRLKANPDEAHRCYNRAYAALSTGKAGGGDNPGRYPAEVLAIWEFIQRSLPLATVKKILEEK